MARMTCVHHNRHHQQNNTMYFRNLRHIDLHLHSMYSDGLLQIPSLIQKAKDYNIKIMSITDHDTVSGVLQVESFVQDNIIIIPGIELSSYTDTEPQLHITGYFRSTANLTTLESVLHSKVVDIRISRCKRIVKSISNAGYMIPYELIEKKLDKCLPSLPIIARVLEELGYVSSYNEAFDKFIGSKAPFYEPVRLFSLKEAIDLIHQYGGVSFVAHPWFCNNPLDACKVAAINGVDGMECFPPENNDQFGSEIYKKFALKNNLLCSSGSDYHGFGLDETLPGENVFPAEDADRLIEMFKKQLIV